MNTTELVNRGIGNRKENCGGFDSPLQITNRCERKANKTRFPVSGSRIHTSDSPIFSSGGSIAMPARAYGSAAVPKFDLANKPPPESLIFDGRPAPLLVSAIATASQCLQFSRSPFSSSDSVVGSCCDQNQWTVFVSCVFQQLPDCRRRVSSVRPLRCALVHAAFSFRLTIVVKNDTALILPMRQVWQMPT